ncbi:MAG TPA: MATE family efflux transporter, partial [Anaeromyxobacteraceae bacterium]|nr:MATE family efflux transporter [Anaeromyxobacteraceae bacterium]
MSSAPAIRDELSQLARLAIPMAIATAGQALMGVVDTAVAGRAGAVTLAGTGLGVAVFTAFTVFAMGLMLGLDPLVSQAIGAGDPLRARRMLWQGAWLSLALGVIVAIPAALVSFALEPGGIPPDVAREAGRYLVVRAPGLPGMLFFFAARSYFQGVGRTREVVVATVLANVLNLALDVLFVFGGAGLPSWTGPLRAIPPMGAAGAALATTFVCWAEAAMLAFAAARDHVPGPIRRAPDRRDIREALRVGTPVGLHMGAEVGVFALVGFLAGRLGADQIAAHQIAISIASFSFTVAVGIGNAGGIRVGWAVGARDRAGARRAGLVAFAAGAAFMAMAGLVYLASPRALARLMTDDPRVLATAAPLLLVAAVFQVSDGVQAVGAGVLRGVGDTHFTF